MRHTRLFGLVLVLLLTSYNFAAAQGMPAGVKAGKSAAGAAILTDSKGMTLYTFAKDAAGKSNCNGQCATNWPPLMAAADAKAMGDWTIVTRDDGMHMWAHKGMPVYTWVKDQKPGDTTGDGVGNGAWKIATP